MTPSAQNQSKRIDLLGCPVDAVSMDEAVHRIGAAMRLGTKTCHAALNTAKLVKMGENHELWHDVAGADLITADGMGIVLAGRLLGKPLPGRVTGIDLMDRVLGLCARKGFRPYFLGAKPDVLQAACYRLSLRHPRLRIAGAHHGYFGKDDEDRLVDQINASRADCLFVAMPSPKKERFIARHRACLKPSFIMGVGGSLDVFAGHVERAPDWMQHTGLEWLYRTYQEPKRMWRRYLTTNAAFMVLMLKALASRATGDLLGQPKLAPPGSSDGST